MHVINKSRRGDGAEGLVEDIGGSSGQVKRCVTKLVHNLAVSSWP